MGRWARRLVVLGYLGFLLLAPVALILWRTFEHGLAPVWDALSSQNAVHALKVTLEVSGCAVALNTVFGVATALLLTRTKFPGRGFIDAIIDLPIAVSPVIVGLALILVYGRHSNVGSWLATEGVNIIFAMPGMVLATVFVSLPFVVRAVAPVLEELGDDQEQAAATLGANAVQRFVRITLPSIRHALAYGMVLSLARALGEFGAIAVVSGRIAGKTETASIYVQDRFQNFDQQGAYAMSAALVLTAVVAIIVARFLRPDEGQA